MSKIKFVMLSSSISLSLLASAPAAADWKTRKVRHADLDLSTEAGRNHLQLRIKRAVKDVCGSPRAITLTERQDKIACEKQANMIANRDGTRSVAPSTP